MINFVKRQIEKASDFYRKKSIQFMISISFTFIAVIGTIFMGTSLFLRFTAVAEASAGESNKRIVDQVNLNLDGYLKNMMKVSDSMYYRVIKNCDLATDDFKSEINLLYESNRDSLVSIAVFTSEGKLVEATPVDALKKTVNPPSERWFINAQRQIENIHFSTPHVQNLFDDADYKYRWVISLSRAVELTEGGNTYGGVLLVDMNYSAIEQLFRNSKLGNFGYLYLINHDGEIIYHPRQQLIYSNLEFENNVMAAQYEDGNYKEVFQKESRMITVKTVGYTGWKIVGVMPISDVYSSYFQIQIFMAFILLFTILLLTFANIFVSSKIATPIKALEESVKELENGRQNVEIAIGGSYEIRHLGAAIQSMVKQMRRLMDDIVIEQESKRKSELDALQSQINPHFLYNTLDSIVWMVENERYQEAIVMVTSLAAFFRVGLSKGKNIITLDDELRHAGSYITIQHMRFRDKFTFNINAEKETLSLTSIKLIIQPILENAVYHGMEFMDGDGEIEINAYLKENDLYIDIVDNGMGIPQETADKLLTQESKSRGKGSGIGLKNVQERIQLYFGMEYGLTILSEPDVGTTVRIHLPKVEYHSVKQWGVEKK